MTHKTIDARLRWCLSPKLVFTPEHLDFGCLAQHEKATRELHVYNLHGPIDHCSVVCNDENPWVRIVHIKSMSGYEQACICITVEVDTSLLIPGRAHTSWLAIGVDQIDKPIQVAVTVAARQMALLERWRLFQIFVAPLLAVMLISALLSFLSTLEITPLNHGLPLSLLALRSQPERNVLSFVAYEEQKARRLLTTVTAAGQQSLGVGGWSPVWSPDGAQLAFVNEQSGVPQLYMIPAMGGVPIPLTSSMDGKSAPAWSANGADLAYIAGKPGQGVLRLLDTSPFTWAQAPAAQSADDHLRAVINILFGQSRQLGKPIGVTQHFAWSPTDRALLLDYYRDDQIQLLYLDANGTVTVVAANSWAPAWSPDGKHFAAVSAAGLFRAALAGGKQHYLSARPAQAPAWSPVGDRIAFLAPQRTTTAATTDLLERLALWVVDLVNDQETLLSTDCAAFAWAPDGHQLAYVTGDDQADAPLLYLWLVTPGAKPTLLAEIGASTIAWKPLP